MRNHWGFCSTAGTVAVTLFGLGCGSPSGPGPAATSARLQLSGPATLAPGQTAQFKLTEASANGRWTRDVTRHATWTSSNDGVLAIDRVGVATTRERGEAQVTAAMGDRSEAVTVFVVPAGTYVVKGTVVDADTGASVSDARVQALSASTTLLETSTDPGGRYQLYGVPGDAELRVSQDGFVSEVRLAISDHAALDVRLARRGVQGRYTLTVEAGSACSFPEQVRTRTYTAAVVESRRAGTFDVTLSDATFLEPTQCNSFIPPQGCNQFFIHKQGERISFSMVDFEWGYGGNIVEKLPDSTWFLLSAYGEGRLDGSNLEFLGTGEALHCPSAQGSPRCLQISYCRSNDVRLRFTRR